MKCAGKCAGKCSVIGASSLMDDPPYREGEDPHPFSVYKRFWAGGTPWRKFFLPGGAEGPAINTTDSKPGVYEFAISMSRSPTTMVPVYVGKSNNVRQRHLGYLKKGGDHISDLMGPAMQQGCTVWQRVRYLKSDLQAQRWEARFLVDYDYAWNKDLNPDKRPVYLEYRSCCCMAVSVDVVSPAKRTPILSAPLKSCTGWTGIASIAAQLLCALTVILIVALQLGGVPRGDPGSTQLTSQCLLGTDAQGRSLCVYTYVVAGVSMALSLVLGAVSGLKVTACGRGASAVTAAAMSIWWAVAAIVLTRYMAQADRDGVPQGDWRQAVTVLSWVEAGLWGTSWLVHTMLSVLGCCAGRSRASRRHAEGADGYGGGGASPSAPTAPDSPSPLAYAPYPQFMASSV